MTSSNKGKFIVIEGIDGCGGETQTKKLVRYLRQKRIPVQALTYPDYKGPIGKVIHAYLHKRHDFSKEVQFLLYFADFLKDKERIKRWKKDGKTIIADRYFSSTIAYQCLNGISVERALRTSKLFDLPRPDLIIFLHISPEVSMQRKMKEKRGKLDRHEADKKFLAGLAVFYKQLAKRQALARWVVVDGERPIEDVFTEIKKVVI